MTSGTGTHMDLDEFLYDGNATVTTAIPNITTPLPTQQSNSAGLCESSTPTQDVIAVTLWGILLVYGLVTNIYTLAAIYATPSLRTSTSYWLIFNLSICDSIMICISGIHLLPAVMFHARYVSVFSYRNAFAIFLYNIFWYTAVLGLCAMAVNRFVSIMYPMHYAQVFSRRNTAACIGGLYVGGFSIALPAAFECCLTIWNHECYLTHFVHESASAHYGNVDLIINSTVVGVMIVSYGSILFRVRASRLAAHGMHGGQHVGRGGKRFQIKGHRLLCRSTNSSDTNSNTVNEVHSENTGGYSDDKNGNQIGKNKDAPYLSALASASINALNAVPAGVPAINAREMRLFIQFGLVAVIFFTTFITWQITFRILSGTTSIWVFFAMTGLFFVNNGTSPTVYLIFNPAIRGEIGQMFPFKHFKARRGSKKQHQRTPKDTAERLIPQDSQSNSGPRRTSQRQKFANSTGAKASLLHNYEPSIKVEVDATSSKVAVQQIGTFDDLMSNPRNTMRDNEILNNHEIVTAQTDINSINNDDSNNVTIITNITADNPSKTNITHNANSSSKTYYNKGNDNNNNDVEKNPNQHKNKDDDRSEDNNKIAEIDNIPAESETNSCNLAHTDIPNSSPHADDLLAISNCVAISPNNPVTSIVNGLNSVEPLTSQLFVEVNSDNDDCEASDRCLLSGETLSDNYICHSENDCRL